ncbi:hypothetical protein [Tsukamurella sp. 1534]|uniref:hypothetical protein n=1 Tax=Tsukamurella sp. 1534 TaxID=1151061 RepID=UPI000318DFEA|nr:hypothetical protein [Tsukamurella sp. 1534]
MTSRVPPPRPAPSRERRETSRRWLEPAAAGAIVTAASVVVAWGGVVVTSAGDDQARFHLPSVMLLRATAPDFDLVGMPTATGPLYHAVVAALAGLFGLGPAGTQAVGSIFAVLLAVVAVHHVQPLPTWVARAVAVAPLLLSAYYWQSALWMLTDDAAMLFAFGALALSTRSAGARGQLAVGVLIAAAIATRQNSVWLLVPACAAHVVCGPGGRPAWPGAAAVARLCLPGVAVLGALVAVWGGVAPPAGRAMNAMHTSPAAPSYVAAVAAVFLTPVLLAAVDTASIRRHFAIASAMGVLVAVPALTFPSAATAAPDDSRRGGLVWALVGAFPDLGGRSPVLVVLAFAGGFVATVLTLTLPARCAAVLAGSLVALAVVLVSGAQLYQKYVELPVAVLVVLVLVQLFAADRVARRWPLVALAALQALFTAGLVVLPILRTLVV